MYRPALPLPIHAVAAPSLLSAGPRTVPVASRIPQWGTLHAPRPSFAATHPATVQRRHQWNRRPDYVYFENTRPPIYARRSFWGYAGVCLGLGGVYYMSHLEEVPLTKRRRFLDITPSQEEILARSAYKQIMTEYGNRILPPSHPYTRFVKEVAVRLIAVSGMPDLNWEVYVVDAPEKNAFVLPGGKIFVYTGILPVVQDENGMAAVLGHEIAHQVARHSAEKMSNMKIVILLQVLLALVLSGEPFWLSRIFFDLGIMKPFSRKVETEADYIGLLLMAQACYDPRAAVDMWQRMSMATRNEPPQYLSTHPSHNERIKMLSKWMPEAINKRDLSNCATVGSFLDQFYGSARAVW
ncbi:hypothetical protein M427DRAFT_30031 [Gonapodya prolifera JEL478]|uniref:Peptidase M48 domain-containing protein n=1 Tax=Gonapodya prolifera (strain JEL478) TaxID=1344416 RepID=A0A139AMA6_GONPJ|nr:hypothetical protein M427DRAFT_30031 [Gonapodya prolifera JEL478]|eukprot:KXS17901.1 hypothetical protein M427DRAFT_30031 [Gonapodya prolifera JEL478]